MTSDPPQGQALGGIYSDPTSARGHGSQERERLSASDGPAEKSLKREDEKTRQRRRQRGEERDLQLEGNRNKVGVLKKGSVRKFWVLVETDTLKFHDVGLN